MVAAAQELEAAQEVQQQRQQQQQPTVGRRFSALGGLRRSKWGSELQGEGVTEGGSGSASSSVTVGGGTPIAGTSTCKGP